MMRAKRNFFRPSITGLGPAAGLLPTAAQLGPWSIRKRVLDATAPWLGDFGASAKRFMEVIDVMDRKSLEIYSEKKSEVEAGVTQQAWGGKDVISGLRECAQFDALRTVVDE